MIRTLALATGLATGVATSQAPEFTQQYLQRLAGQVDALTQVVVDFDRSALQAGLGREEALTQMTGSEFLTARQADMRRTFARHSTLTSHLDALRAATPLARLTMPHRINDAATLSATWSDFKPALPLTAAGITAGGIGTLTGWALFSVLFALITSPFRRAPILPTSRREPTLRRPDTHPHLTGARR